MKPIHKVVFITFFLTGFSVFIVTVVVVVAPWNEIQMANKSNLSRIRVLLCRVVGCSVDNHTLYMSAGLLR